MFAFRRTPHYVRLMSNIRNVDIDATRTRLGRVGVWLGALGSLPAAQARDAVGQIEAMGYPTLWITESQQGSLCTRLAGVGGFGAAHGRNRDREHLGPRARNHRVGCQHARRRLRRAFRAGPRCRSCEIRRAVRQTAGQDERVPGSDAGRRRLRADAAGSSAMVDRGAPAEDAGARRDQGTGHPSVLRPGRAHRHSSVARSVRSRC